METISVLQAFTNFLRRDSELIKGTHSGAYQWIRDLARREDERKKLWWTQLIVIVLVSVLGVVTVWASI